MKTEIGALLKNNEYPGRGLIVGENENGEYAVAAYFIMGRSENSRNRVFRTNGDLLFTYPFDESKVTDKSLIIYNAARKVGEDYVVSNGDQTDTIYHTLLNGGSFEDALRTRTYEPDRPNYTPRISAILHTKGGLRFTMSILKKSANSDEAERAFFEYSGEAGTGRFISTYQHNGDPLPSFEGCPRSIVIKGSIDDFIQEIWNALDENNRISLYVRFISLRDGNVQERMINKHIER